MVNTSVLSASNRSLADEDDSRFFSDPTLPAPSFFYPEPALGLALVSIVPAERTVRNPTPWSACWGLFNLNEKWDLYVRPAPSTEHDTVFH